MDPSAPGGKDDSQNPTFGTNPIGTPDPQAPVPNLDPASGEPANPNVQPGQYVVAGEDAQGQQHPQDPPHPLDQPTFTAPTSAPIGAPPAPAHEAVPTPPMSGFNIASTQTTPNVAQDPTLTQQTQAPSSAPSPSGLPPIDTNQPDPSPYTPPPPTQDHLPDGESKLKKFRTVFIILAIVLLLGIIAGIAYFFIFGKTNKAVQTGNTQTVEEPPLPAGGDKGFADLPSATSEATPSSAF